MSEILIDDDYTLEIIDGKIYYMSPGTTAHLRALTRIGYAFHDYFKLTNKKCEAYTEGLEVYLDKDNEKNYVVPDVSIICDEEKFDQRGYKGVPTLIAEVLSPKTAKKDKTVKLLAYEKAGVQEYWIVSTKEKSIDQYILENGKYVLKDIITLLDNVDFEKLDEQQKSEYSPVIIPSMFEDLKIDLNEIFD